MIYKIKELIDEGYTIEFKPLWSPLEDKEALNIILSKNNLCTNYILTYSELQNSIWDPDVVICQKLDDIKNSFKSIYRGVLTND